MLELIPVGHCFHPEAMVMRGHSWRAAKFPAIIGLINHPSKGYILFDTGYAKRFTEATNNFPERLYRIVTPMHLCDKEQLGVQLKSRGVDVADINYIFISHFHADHIAGLYDFPNATFVCSRHGLDYISRRKGLRALIKGYLPSLLPLDFQKRVHFIENSQEILLGTSCKPFYKAFDLFGDGSCLAVELPGHAVGHFGMMLHANNKINFLIGDACWTEEAYRSGVKPNFLTHLVMHNGQQYLSTLEKLGRLHSINQEIAIIPSHCEKTYKRWLENV